MIQNCRHPAENGWEPKSAYANANADMRYAIFSIHDDCQIRDLNIGPTLPSGLICGRNQCENKKREPFLLKCCWNSVWDQWAKKIETVLGGSTMFE